MDYTGVQFTSGHIRLDGNRFTDCVFDGAMIAYDGGPVHLVGCRFEKVAGWHFGGALGSGLRMLGQLFAQDHENGLRLVSQAMFRPREEAGARAA